MTDFSAWLKEQGAHELYAAHHHQTDGGEA